jgi:hypothetical protein
MVMKTVSMMEERRKEQSAPGEKKTIERRVVLKDAGPSRKHEELEADINSRGDVGGQKVSRASAVRR